MSKLETEARTAGGAFVPARHTVALVAVALLALAAATACGGGSKSSKGTSSAASSSTAAGSFSTPVPSGTAHAINALVARSVRLGTPQTVFFARYGTPVLTRGAGANTTCDYYYAVGYRPIELLWGICFYKGKLSTVASANGAAYVSGGRLVLKPTPTPSKSKGTSKKH